MVQKVPDTDTPKRKTRTGGRSGPRKARFEALRDEGYEKLSIVRVAAAAGVHENSTYRRWGGKGADAVPTPDTGSIQSALDQFVGQVVRVLKSHEGRALSSGPRGSVLRG